MKRKIFTSILALVLAFSMMPMSVLASQSGSQTGDVISEGNPAEDIFRVVLPVTTTDTYDLTLDPYDLLSTSSLGGDRASYDGSSVYFGIASDPTVTITAGGTLYAETKTVSADVTDFDIDDYFTVVDTAVTAITADTLYVWAPQSGQEALGLGEYVALTMANYEDYFTLTLTETAATGFTYAATSACDGLLYVSEGAAVTPAEAVGYCTIVSDAVDSLDGLFTDAALSSAADPADLTYTPSEVSHTNKATTVTATNKSTYGVVLNVELNATNTTTPVVFTTTANVEGDTELNLALDILGDDASAVSNVVKNSGDADGTTNVDFYLSGTASNYTQYQGAVDSDTGGHSYNYLEKVAPTWSDIDFGIQGACNTTADWSAYNATLAADNRLALEVVYTMTAAEDVTATPGDNYDSATGVIQLIPTPAMTVSTTGLVTITGLSSSINMVTTNIGAADGTYDSLTTQSTTYPDVLPLANNAATWDLSGWTAENGGTVTIQLGEGYTGYYTDESTYILTLDDDSTLTQSVTFE
jgi:hypothetical protein